MNKALIAQFKGFVLGMINNLEPHDLIEMINTNYIPPLYEYELPGYLNGIVKIVQENKEKIMEQLTYENVMTLGVEFRPDLLAILKHPKGQRWMKSFLKMVGFIVENAGMTSAELKHEFFRRMREIKAKKAKLMSEQEAREIIQTETPPPTEEEFNEEEHEDSQYGFLG